MNVDPETVSRFQDLARSRQPAKSIGEVPEFNLMLWSSETVRIGRFAAPVGHPRFRDSGPIPEHVVVFPRSAVTIHHSGGQPFAADATRTTFYNRRQEYTRSALDRRGDHCDWFAFPTAIVVQALESHGLHPGRAERPFRFSWLPCDRATFLEQRLLVARLENSPAPEPLLVEESALRVLGLAIRAAATEDDPGSRCLRRHRDLADAARELLACRFREPMELAQLAAAVGCSVYHLCRVFRRQTGRTLHQHRSELRLRAALEAVAERKGRLTEVAFDLGYSSHAHLTDSFRRAFGLSPSAYLELLGGHG